MAKSNVGVWLELSVQLPEGLTTDQFKGALYNRLRDVLGMWSRGEATVGRIIPDMIHKLDGYDLEVFLIGKGAKDQALVSHCEVVATPPPGGLKEFSEPHVVIAGDLTKGFNLVGPFVDSESATDWGDKYVSMWDEFVVLEMASPMDNEYVAEWDAEEEDEEKDTETERDEFEGPYTEAELREMEERYGDRAFID